MPVEINELEVVPQPTPATATSGRPARAATVDALRNQVRGLGYAEGAQRLSPRQGGTGGAGASAAPTQIGSGGATVRASGSGVEINASSVTINAPVTRATGVVSADTVQATNVIGANYTPGSGNVM